MEVSPKAEGTTHEELLKWISGNPTSKLRVHLCGKACPAKVEAKDLVHALKVRLKVTSDEGSWAENLRGTVDELAGLRAEGQVVAEQQRRLQEEEKKHKKEKEKESKKKEKKRDRKRRSSTKSSVWDHSFGPRPSGEEESSEAAQKTHEAKEAGQQWEQWKLYSRELSPHQYGEQRVGGGVRGLARSIAKKAPGALAFTTIKEMQRQLLTSTGTVWCGTKKNPRSPCSHSNITGPI